MKAALQHDVSSLCSVTFEVDSISSNLDVKNTPISQQAHLVNNPCSNRVNCNDAFRDKGLVPPKFC